MRMRRTIARWSPRDRGPAGREARAGVTLWADVGPRGDRMRSVQGAVTLLAPVGADDRRCGACGRGNDRRRELCSVCGADLDTGLAVETSWDGGTRRAARSRSERRERSLLIGLGAAVVVVAAIAPLALLGLGPFSSTEHLEAALLLRAAYPDEPVVLGVETVATTTSAVAPDRDLSALSLIDGDGLSAWVGLPVGADGTGEVIQLVLERPAWVVRIQVRNGDHLSPAAYERSARLQRGLLTFDGGRDHRIDLLDIGRQAQVIELSSPELTTRITIRVDRVFAGSGPLGVALSEVSLVGWPADASDATLARQRARWS